MTCERSVSCEDWVWVKDKAFSVSEEDVQPNIFVSWNGTEKMFAITTRLGNRRFLDEKDNSKTGSFSLEAVYSVHHTLHGLNPSIPRLPHSLPKLPKGLNTIFQGVKIPIGMNNVCPDLEKYFADAAQIIGGKLLQEVMFEMASEDLENYYEKMSDVHKQDLQKKILYVEDELKNIAFERDNCNVMRELEDIYQREDESAVKLISAFANYYNFQLQPYLDSECLANKKIEEYRRKMADENLAESVLAEYKEQHIYWACLLIETKTVIIDLQIEHRTSIVSIFKELLEQIYIDKNRYGSSAFDLVAASRELHLKKEVYTAEEQLLQSRRKQIKLEKDKVDVQIPQEEEQKKQINVELLRAESDNLQIQIFTTEIDILNCKRKTLTCKIEIRRREIAESKDMNVSFHDAVEDLEALSSEDEDDDDENDEELLELKRERVSVSQHQSKIRNKKGFFVKKLRENKNKVLEEQKRVEQHHLIQKKRDLQREEENKRSSIAFEERKRTIERLKEYKMKYATPPTIKPPRYQRPSEKSKNGNAKQVDKSQTIKSKENMSSSRRVPSKSHTEKPWKKSGRQKSKDVQVTIHLPKDTNSPQNKERIDPSPVPPPPPPPPPTSTPPPPPPPPSAPPPPPPPPPPPLPSPPPPPPSFPMSPQVPGSANQQSTASTSIADGLKNLKKTEKNESQSSSQSPRQIDLKSILASKSQLKPAKDRSERPGPEMKDSSPDIFSMIRNGVTLKKVTKPEVGQDGSTNSSSANEDVRTSLHNTIMKRLTRSVRGDSPDSDEDECSENEEFED